MTTDGVLGTSIERTVVRTCIGCRTRRAQDELVRCTRRDGTFVFDGPSVGRGAWLCRDSLGECAAQALTHRAFQRAWRIDIDEAVVAEIERAIADALGSTGRDDGQVGPH